LEAWGARSVAKVGIPVIVLLVFPWVRTYCPPCRGLRHPVIFSCPAAPVAQAAVAATTAANMRPRPLAIFIILASSRTLLDLNLKAPRLRVMSIWCLVPGKPGVFSTIFATVGQGLSGAGPA